MMGKTAKNTLCLASLLLASCSFGGTSSVSSSLPLGSEETSSELANVPVQGVELQLEANEIFVGETTSFSVVISPSDASVKTYIANASPTSVASIEGNLITGTAPGEARITVTTDDGGHTAEATLHVKERRTPVTDSEYLSSISEDPYRTKTVPNGEGWGLSDTGNVGIDRDLFESEVRYPVPSEGKIYEAADYGIAPGEENNAGRLINLLSELAEVEGVKIVRFASATYEFGNTISGNNLRDIYLVGQEKTKFVFTKWMTYIHFSHCVNAHIQSITFDINPSPTVSGVIVSSEEDDANGYIYVKLDEGYDVTAPAYQRYASERRGSYAEYYYDSTYEAYVPNRSGNLFYNPGLKNLEYSSKTGLLKVTLSKSFPYCSYKAPAPGTVVGIGYQVYENHGFYFQECENTYMEHVTVYTVGGMGMRTDNGKNLYLNHVRFIREPGTKRLLTCTADILHTCNLSGEAIFSNCELEGSHDDAINVKSFYTRITAIRNNVVTVAQTQSEVAIGFEVGDEVDVYNPTGLQYKDTFTVVGVEQIGTTFELTLDKNMPSRGSNSYLGFSLGNATKAVHLTLENSFIKNKRNRGILLQGRHSQIKNCTFQNVVMGAVQVLGVDDVFKEAIVPQDIEITNTKFLQCWDDLSVFTWDASGASTSGTLHDVEISNNYFYHGTGTSLYCRGVGNVSVKNNLFQEMGSKKYSCRILDSQDIALENNAYYLTYDQIGYNFVSASETTTNISQKGNARKGNL
ncbi:MAG: right-handed parallel beta-helix repeat-containing protein [Candidatus Enteromonas sp.]|nr:right-handed parallel beta-helix repeat-containing protein [Candidatus Enteromonas sp.]